MTDINAATVLTDERIHALWKQAIEQFQRHEAGVSLHPSVHLARAIEAELLAHAGKAVAAEKDASFFVVTDASGRAEYVTNLRHEAQEHINDACAEGVEGAGKWKAVPVFEMRPTDDRLWDQTLHDRDTYHEWADKLAEAIAKNFDAHIGEHSNMNCPWAEALEVIESAPAAADIEGLTRYDIEHDGCGWMREYIKGDYVKFADVERLLAHAGVTAEPAAPVQTAEPLVFEDFPEFNAHAMGCGLEDRGITDRYDAMRYGFEEALDLVDERIKNFLADLAAPTIRAQVPAAEVRAAAIESLGSVIKKAVHVLPFDIAGALLAAFGEVAHQSTADKASEVRAASPTASQAALDVLAERRRQIEQEGWTTEHDDKYSRGELSYAACSYAVEAGHLLSGMLPDASREPPFAWPWDKKWWKSGSVRRNLVKAGALILAEIERIDRTAAPSTADSAGTGAMGEGADRG